MIGITGTNGRRGHKCLFSQLGQCRQSDIDVAENLSYVAAGAEQPGASTDNLNQIKNSLRQRALLGPVR